MLKLDKNSTDIFKIKSKLLDFIKAAYKPVLQNYKNNDKISEEENSIAEEYHNLVFYMKKIKQLFEALKHSIKELTGDFVDINTSLHRSDFIDAIGDSNGDSIREALKSVFNFKHFKLFLMISTIPINTEFHYLGELDAIELKLWIDEFDPPFKRYVELVLKKSSIVSKDKTAKLVHL
jgi:hypothetical protein